MTTNVAEGANRASWTSECRLLPCCAATVRRSAEANRLDAQHGESSRKGRYRRPRVESNHKPFGFAVVAFQAIAWNMGVEPMTDEL